MWARVEYHLLCSGIKKDSEVEADSRKLYLEGEHCAD